MESPFLIYVDRLRDGTTEDLLFETSSDFLEVEDGEVLFTGPVHCKGSAYLAEKELILHASLKVQAKMNCKICGKEVNVPLHVEDLYHVVPLEKVRSGSYDFSTCAREEIILSVPHFAECDGNCSKRKELDQYFHKGFKDGSPFAHLD